MILIETIIYCPKSRIGYYEGGQAKDRSIMKNFKCFERSFSNNKTLPIFEFNKIDL